MLPTPKALTPEEALKLAPAGPNQQALANLMLRSDHNEHGYLKFEDILPCDPMTDEMLARMNAAMGFSGDSAKDRDYRPYCGADKCREMPRMFRVREGFRCPACRHVWDLTEEKQPTTTNATS